MSFRIPNEIGVRNDMLKIASVFTASQDDSSLGPTRGVGLRASFKMTAW
ncbi:MAG: hypothetical protein M0P75_02750 [Candidatus Marinimicrobia bacterium]|nr:hypothetical protein [Candidatus Neomarinimicrobiota bacterium]